jgi:inner membrane protein
MDSVTQFALGAAVAAAVLGPRTKPVRALGWGGVVATLPDLDVLIDHGDAVRNMIWHRAESHALFWQTLAAPAIAFGIAALHRERHLWCRWSCAVWLALVTHALLDAMTIYGTRLLLPFTERPFGLGSLFIVDPLYTLPLLAGGAAFLIGRGSVRARRWNLAGLVLSTAYAGWSVVAQQHALSVARESLRVQGVVAENVLATPAPLQTVLWRLVAVTPEDVWEGHWSPFDGAREIEWTRVERGRALREALRGTRAVDDLADFSGGFWKCWRENDTVRIADVRMGMEPRYVFTFEVADAGGTMQPFAVPRLARARLDFDHGIDWLWGRMWGGTAQPPR